ncbi:cupin domain-containing protein [Prevotella herbatica]|uniref:Cupin domain-containing protein n=1 Tax=Prevotella herbatica TaxID=2801997 RepID=A0ABN6EHE3_9BACT|nr:cupin domain-containing protein [Prevotella herbatica]BCS85360.1 cupin domain-containing protein [Prevotella herbatica]
MGFTLKNINTINQVATSHGARIKKVLCTNDETSSNIAQIAVSRLKAGEHVEVHEHETMEEHFIIEEVSLEFMIDDKAMTVDAGSYVMIHSGTKHGIKAVTDCKMITVGCAV